MSQNRVALQYASEELKRDREFIMKAVKKDGRALQHASEELRVREAAPEGSKGCCTTS
ncbi:DUF4116 domain-containing protein [Candidatus Marinamargulisbacteria bacterium]|nr:DUF4116 domain-containing protein [Candidatus Marinamargulisbacteria bacterium]